MSYSSLTKAQLIEELEKSISIEKYNKLEKRMQQRKIYVEDLESKVHSLEKQVGKLLEENKSALENVTKNTNAIVDKARQEYQQMKDDYAYLEDIVSTENELIELYRDKVKRENEFGDKLYEMYHKILFKENKE